MYWSEHDDAHQSYAVTERVNVGKAPRRHKSVPQVRRGQIGTNQAVVERERRVELNLGGRKGKERKVLGLGLGARISRRGVRAHEVGRHLHAEDEGDEGRACP